MKTVIVMTHSQRISDFVEKLTLADIPENVRARARLHLIDTFGVAFRGSTQPHGVNALKAVSAMPGTGGKSVVWNTTGPMLRAAEAALVNGVAAHVLDYDDTHTDSILHGSTILAPTVFALGEELGASDADMLVAYVAGWEVGARIGTAAGGAFHERGFHSTGIAGTFAAAVAAAKLLKLDQQQMVYALGLAGSQTSGVAEYLTNGSASKCFHAGWSAHSGIMAAYLAKAGLTAPETIFEGRYGLYVTHGKPEQANIATVSADLGKSWEMLKVSIKPYPCCHFGHAFISCALMLHEEGIRPETVASIDCVVDPIEAALICVPLERKHEPKTPYEAKFSLPFMIAAALQDGTVGMPTFTPDNIKRPDLLALAKKVSYRDAKPGETTFPRYFPGWLTATLQDGRRIEKRLDINYGNPDNPLTEDDVRRKFNDNVAGVIPDAQAEKLLARLSTFGRAR